MECPNCKNDQFVEVFTGVVTRIVSQDSGGVWRFREMDFETRENVELQCRNCMHIFDEETSRKFLKGVKE